MHQSHSRFSSEVLSTSIQVAPNELSKGLEFKFRERTAAVHTTIIALHKNLQICNWTSKLHDHYTDIVL